MVPCRGVIYAYTPANSHIRVIINVFKPTPLKSITMTVLTEVVLPPMRRSVIPLSAIFSSGVSWQHRLTPVILQKFNFCIYFVYGSTAMSNMPARLYRKCILRFSSTGCGFFCPTARCSLLLGCVCFECKKFSNNCLPRMQPASRRFQERTVVLSAMLQRSIGCNN